MATDTLKKKKVRPYSEETYAFSTVKRAMKQFFFVLMKYMVK